MVPWIESTFGPLTGVETQHIVRVDNLVTGEGTLFNELRAKRPIRSALRVESNLASELAGDPWADPLTSTPEDTFGRLSNAHAVTAANIAKYDAAHAIVIFNEPNPLEFSEHSIAAYLSLAFGWVRRAHAEDPAAIYPYVMWNCLWRAGGSIVHGHIQVSLARGRHYAKIERLRQDAARYSSSTGYTYFDDMLAIHESLGLMDRIGDVRRLAHLTPVKEKECLLVAPGIGDALTQALFRTLRTFRDTLGVTSFNVGMLLPPVAPTPETWAGFPVVVRIVDRGSLETRTSDIGGMEMYAEAVVAADPYAVHAALVPGGS